MSDIQQWLQLSGTPFEVLPRFFTSLAIGLLLGVERERKQKVLAGIRSFPLTALFGTLCAMLGQLLATPLLPVLGLGCIVMLGFLPRSTSDPNTFSEPRTTTVIALLITYVLGLLVWFGHGELAVACGILTSALLYLKPELTGISQKLERRDLLSLLQFVALTFIVLPILPNQNLGPYGVINPHRVWLLVVLIVGVGLSGYLAVRMLGQKVGGPLLGIMGGLVSSTATSLVYSREARSNPSALPLATTVILLANLVLFGRLILLAGLTTPNALGAMALVMLPALLFGLLTVLWQLRRSHTVNQDGPSLTLRNPSELRVALGFGAVFAVVLVCSAWLNDLFGSSGVYVVALISGLTDVDAMTLSALQLFSQNSLAIGQALLAVVLAVISNTVFKFGLISSLGGSALVRRCLPTFVATVCGMLVGLLLLGWHG